MNPATGSFVNTVQYAKNFHQVKSSSARIAPSNEKSVRQPRQPTDHVKVFHLRPANRRAYQRRNELARLIEYRRQYGLSRTHDAVMAIILADLAPFMAALKQEDHQSDRSRSRDSATASKLSARMFNLCIHIGCEIDPNEIREAAEAKARLVDENPTQVTLMTAKRLGALLELTMVERQDIRAVTMDAIDEAPSDRKRRLGREKATRKRRRQGVKPIDQSLSRTKPWEAEGISRATWYRRRKALETAASTDQSSLDGEASQASQNGGPGRAQGAPPYTLGRIQEMTAADRSSTSRETPPVSECRSNVPGLRPGKILRII